MTGAIPVISGVAERGALDRLAATSALNGRGVHEQQVVIETASVCQLRERAADAGTDDRMHRGSDTHDPPSEPR